MFTPLNLIQDGRRIPIPAIFKNLKLDRIEAILQEEYKSTRDSKAFTCLTPELRAQFGVTHESGLSENAYHVPALQLIDKHQGGLVLDFGAGQRNTYYCNVVNLDVMGYDTTDVIAVGERLPFRDNVFDAVHSNAVLEHVKDPFRCAQEIMRVLKPGGDLMCCVPFLQPFHACPHHYYNMTSEGLKNLFPSLTLQSVDVYEELRPITSLQLLITDWANGLSERTRQGFLDMKLRDFLRPYAHFRDNSIVTELSVDNLFKMACGHTIFGTKGLNPHRLKIVTARYGAQDIWIDVTQILSQQIAQNSLVISVHEVLSNFFPDPIFGVSKELHIIWSRVNEHNEIMNSGEISSQEFGGRLRTPIII